MTGTLVYVSTTEEHAPCTHAVRRCFTSPCDFTIVVVVVVVVIVRHVIPYIAEDVYAIVRDVKLHRVCTCRMKEKDQAETNQCLYMDKSEKIIRKRNQDFIAIFKGFCLGFCYILGFQFG